MKCPKCGSNNTQYVAVHHVGKSGSFLDACCGVILLGPIGILCGLCGASPGYTDDYWICNDCGKKFQAFQSKQAEKEKAQKAEQELQKKARRQALLSNANPQILENIDVEIQNAKERHKQLKQSLQIEKRNFLNEHPSCKIQHVLRWVGRSIFIFIFALIGFLGIGTWIVPALMMIPIYGILTLPPYYIKLSPELSELSQACESANKYYEYLSALKRAKEEDQNDS